jgi:secretion/DNA translocation related TadE-like protein
MARQRGEVGRRKGSAGVATVLAVGWMVVLLMVGGVGLVLGYAASRQHHVDAAADLVALSAAAGLQRGADPCAVAGSVARANRVVLHGCRVARQDVIVSVRAQVRLPFGLHPWISAQARAGPG